MIIENNDSSLKNILKSKQSFNLDLSELLKQALKSKENKVIRDILQNKNKDIIVNTIERLDEDQVVILGMQLLNIIESFPIDFRVACEWLNILITIKHQILKKHNDIINKINTISLLLDTKINNTEKVIDISAKIDCLHKYKNIILQENEDVLSKKNPKIEINITKNNAKDNEYNKAYSYISEDEDSKDNIPQIDDSISESEEDIDRDIDIGDLALKDDTEKDILNLEIESDDNDDSLSEIYH